MFRFLAVSGLIFLFERYDTWRNGPGYVLSASASLFQRYSLGLYQTFGFIAIPLVISLMIDWKLIHRMFLTRKGPTDSFPWETFVFLNWICSGVFTIAMTHILSHGGLKNISNQMFPRERTYEFRFAVVLAFLSVTYLIGFFGVSLAAHDVSTSSSRQRSSTAGLTSFVPPIYYLGVVAFVWQLDTSLFLRTFVCAISMVFFAAIHLSRFVHAANAPPIAPIDTSLPNCNGPIEAPKCDGALSETGDYSKLDTQLYIHYPLSDNISKMWYRQLKYDLLVYSLPLVIIGFFIPTLRLAVHGMVYVLSCMIPLYEFVATKLYFKPSEPENPVIAAERLTSYPNDGAFVNGWFRLADSEDLPKGAVKYIVAMGRHYALFRGQDGIVRCIDAHCLHLGANLAVGGRVVGNCIECPFHKWRFDGEGNCTHIPYQAQIPQQAKTRSYQICEYYGIILVWYHAYDEAPAYFPPELAKFKRGEMAPRGKRETVVNMHINEFAENSTDFMHFDPLHGHMLLPFTPIEVPGLTVNHAPGWKQGEGSESHICWFLDNADLSFCGAKIPNTAASAVITIVGPAGIVFFTFETPIGTIILFQTHTPLEPLRLHTTFRWYADAEMPRMLVWYVVGSWIAQWRNDIMVWENKKFAARPLLVRGDGPMQKQRRWFKQFYSQPRTQLGQLAAHTATPNAPSNVTEDVPAAAASMATSVFTQASDRTKPSTTSEKAAGATSVQSLAW